AALQRSGGLWIASAMSDLDREHAASGRLTTKALGTGHDLRYLAFDPSPFDGFYNQISNRVLWFVHHYLWELPRSPRWGAELPSARVDLRRRIVRWRGREVRVRVYPISIDAEALRQQAAAPEVAVAERRLTRWAGGDRIVLRVDRTDLSKNILRGLLAFETLLE